MKVLTKSFWYIITLITFISSCDNSVKTSIDDSNNAINLNKVIRIKNIYYENSNKIYGVGPININGTKIGRWNFFDKNGHLKRTFEYIIIKGKRQTNKGWTYQHNNANDTLWDKTSFFKILGLKTKYKLYDTIDMKIIVSPLSSFDTLAFYYSDKINNDFSNLKSIKLDTFKTTDSIVGLQQICTKKGWQNFRVVIDAYIKGIEKKTGKFAKMSQHMYIDEKYYVE